MHSGDLLFSHLLYFHAGVIPDNSLGLLWYHARFGEGTFRPKHWVNDWLIVSIMKRRKKKKKSFNGLTWLSNSKIYVCVYMSVYISSYVYILLNFTWTYWMLFSWTGSWNALLKEKWCLKQISHVKFLKIAWQHDMLKQKWWCNF